MGNQTIILKHSMRVILRMMQPNATVLMLFHLDNLGVQFKCSSLDQQNSLIINHSIALYKATSFLISGY